MFHTRRKRFWDGGFPDFVTVRESCTIRTVYKLFFFFFLVICSCDIICISHLVLSHIIKLCDHKCHCDQKCHGDQKYYCDQKYSRVSNSRGCTHLFFRGFSLTHALIGYLHDFQNSSLPRKIFAFGSI